MVHTLMFWRSKQPTRTRLPADTRIYAVGDIHGRADLLAQKTQRIDAHEASNPVENSIRIYLGDYIDRGPASRRVIDHLIAESLRHNSVFLQGNHEALLLAFLAAEDKDVKNSWIRNGGLQTATSYGVDPTSLQAAALRAVIPQAHIAFFKQLKLSFEIGEYFFVHAGVRPGVSFAKQAEEDLLWIRGEFLNYKGSFGKVVVHGHTPVCEPEVRPHRINIDTGAFRSGRLTCLVLEGNDIAFI